MSSPLFISTLFLLSTAALSLPLETEPAGVAATCTTANIPVLRRCYTTYLAGFNLTMTMSLPPFQQYAESRNYEMAEDGRAGRAYDCSQVNQLVGCVQSQQACMSASTYLQLGAANYTEADQWWMDLAVSTYACGPGYQIGQDNLYCMDYCTQKQSSQIQKCVDTFQNNLSGGMNSCQAEQLFVNCQMNILTNCCNYNTGVYFCNINLQGCWANDPTCVDSGKVTCPKPSSLVGLLGRKMSIKGRF